MRTSASSEYLRTVRRRPRATLRRNPRVAKGLNTALRQQPATGSRCDGRGARRRGRRDRVRRGAISIVSDADVGETVTVEVVDAKPREVRSRHASTWVPRIPGRESDEGE